MAIEHDLYFISMAARLLDMHPQTLRKYERLGLVRPTRTVGSMRVYSEDELERLRLIKHLVDRVNPYQLNISHQILKIFGTGLIMRWGNHSTNSMSPRREHFFFQSPDPQDSTTQSDLSSHGYQPVDLTASKG